MKHYPLIRTIYLYLFSLVGLALLIIGCVRFIDMGLRTFVFTKAELPEKIESKYYYPRTAPLPILEKYQANGDLATELSEEEKVALKNLLEDYKKWQEEENKIDYLASRKQREASTNLAIILVGLPLYFYHWQIIRRETKNKNSKHQTSNNKQIPSTKFQ